MLPIHHFFSLLDCSLLYYVSPYLYQAFFEPPLHRGVGTTAVKTLSICPLLLGTIMCPTATSYFFPVVPQHCWLKSFTAKQNNNNNKVGKKPTEIKFHN